MPVSSTQLTYENFIVVYHYDISPYFKNVAFLKQCYEKLDTICLFQGKNPDLNCNMLLHHSANSVRKIEADAQIIKSQENSKNRSKRAWINGIGYAAKYVIGTLDEDDAEYYDSEIENLKANVTQQHKLIEKHLLITEKLTRYTNSSFQEVNRKLNEFNEVITRLMISEAEKRDEKAVNSLITMFTLILIEVESVAAEFMRLLSHPAKNRLIDLIPKEQLEQSLRTIELSLSSDKELPITIGKDNLFNIFKVTNLKTTLHKDRILMELTIPIIDREKFQIFRAIPIPSEFGDQFAIIKPTSDLFLTNTERSKYIAFAENDLDNCLFISENKSVCSHFEQIYNDPNTMCELMLLSAPYSEKIPSSCHIQQIPKHNYYINLHTTNSFYCVIATQMHPQIICPDKVEPNRLINSGILQLRGGCYLKDGPTILKPHSSTTFDVKEIINPEIKLNNSFGGNLTTLSYNHSLNFIRSFNSDFEEISDSLKEMEQTANQETFNSNIQGHLSKTVKATSGVGVFFFLIIFLYICKKCNFCCCLIRLFGICKTNQEIEEPTIIWSRRGTPRRHRRVHVDDEEESIE